MDIAEFLTARLDEDQRVAEHAAESIYGETWGTGDSMPLPAEGLDRVEAGEHIARHDPTRVLADVAARRAIVAVLRDNPSLVDGAGEYFDDVVRALVQPYADHPDFDPSWRTEPVTT